uniref:PCI domain-containing protein n=1 Tax=Steinernema glaseri TaxID=37863 RepID=A0A1I8A566_9BILA
MTFVLSAEATIAMDAESDMLKARHATLAKLASKHSSVPYDVLKKELGVESVRELEEIFVSAKYAGVCNGRLNCRDEAVEFSDWMTQPVQEGEIEDMTQLLSQWIGKCESVHQDLLQQLATSEKEFAEQKEREARVQAEIEKTQKQIESGAIARDRSPSSTALFSKEKRENAKRARGVGRPFKRH